MFLFDRAFRLFGFLIMIITCATDSLGHGWFNEIQTLHDSPTPGSHSVLPARQTPKFPRPTQQLHEDNVSPLTLAPEGKKYDSLSFPPSSTRVSSSDVDSCRSGLKNSPSIVRGFSPSHISSSFWSQAKPNLTNLTNCTQATTRPKPSPLKKRSGVFTLGGSISDDESSFRAGMATQWPRDDATDGGLAKSETSLMSKMAPFSDQLSLRTIRHPKSPCSLVKGTIEKGSEVSENTFEDNEDFEWEDSESVSGRSSDDEQGQLFQRMDSRPNLVSLQSMLTMMMNQPGRAQENAFRSSPVLQGSRLTSPRGISISASLPESDQESSTVDGPNIPQSKLIIVKPSPPPSVVHSPRAVRRKMVATELSDSDCRNLPWERQQRGPTTNVCSKRCDTAHDMKIPQEYPGPKGPHKGMSPIQSRDDSELNTDSQAQDRNIINIDSWTSYTTDYGPWEHHFKGW